jgi:hypothetical protein
MRWLVAFIQDIERLNEADIAALRLLPKFVGSSSGHAAGLTTIFPLSSFAT